MGGCLGFWFFGIPITTRNCKFKRCTCNTNWKILTLKLCRSKLCLVLGPVFFFSTFTFKFPLTRRTSGYRNHAGIVAAAIPAHKSLLYRSHTNSNPFSAQNVKLHMFCSSSLLTSILSLSSALKELSRRSL